MNCVLQVFKIQFQLQVICALDHAAMKIRQLSAVDVKALQKKVDALSRDYRILDNRIQAANWTADLIEE